MKLSILKSAVFIKSVGSADQLGYGNFPEFAFIGRSNVGKSSLINALTGKKNLALTSSSPGKTRTINLFFIDNSWTLVDLPGYGYARRSKAEREQWSEIISDYVLFRKNLACLFVLVDANISPQETDIEFINNVGRHQIPLSLIFTKTDKSTQAQIAKNIELFKSELLKFWEELPPVFITSALKKKGVSDIAAFIQQSLQTIKALKRKKE